MIGDCYLRHCFIIPLPIGSEEFLSQIIEVLGIIIVDVPKEDLAKGENKT